MPYDARSRSSTLLAVKSNDRTAVEAAVRRWARSIAARRPEIRRIIWFGSRVNGTSSPGSDVDVCVLISHSERPCRDRISDYLPFGFPVGMDIFPYTAAELDRLRSEHPSWYEALTSGVDLMEPR